MLFSWCAQSQNVAPQKVTDSARGSRGLGGRWLFRMNMSTITFDSGSFESSSTSAAEFDSRISVDSDRHLQRIQRPTPQSIHALNFRFMTSLLTSTVPDTPQTPLQTNRTQSTSSNLIPHTLATLRPSRAPCGVCAPALTRHRLCHTPLRSDPTF